MKNAQVIQRKVGKHLKKIHGTNTKHQDQRPNNKYAIIILSVNVL